MRHHPVAVRFACAILAAAAACLSGACAAAPPAAALPAGCQDLTPDRPAGSAHHLHGARQLMGTSFQVRVVTPDLAGGCAAIEAAFAEVAREEALFSEYQPASEISAVNRAAGVAPIKVDAEVFGVLQRSLWASRVTGGAFDMTFAGCGALWSVRAQRIPDSESLAACMPKVGFRKVRLDERESSAFLPEPGMRIGLGGIAKGYGVDRATDLLLALGFTNTVVDGGGDLRMEGSDVDGPWTVNIAHPRQPDAVFETIRVGRGAVVTSGDYLRYFERDGVRYHHIIDPSTGWPASRSMAVTVIAPTATDADALATGLFVLGPERGLAAIAGLPGVEALFFAPDLTVHVSAGFPRGTRPAGAGHSHE